MKFNTPFRLIHLIIIILVVLVIGSLFTISFDSQIQSLGEVDSPAVKLAEGWQYRWGDSPLDTAGIPLWTYDDLANPTWQPLPILGWPPNRQGRANLWLRITLPTTGQWHIPSLFIPQTSQRFELYLEDELIYRFGELGLTSEPRFRGQPWHLITLPTNFQGKQLNFRIYSDRVAPEIMNEVTLNSRGEQVQAIIVRELDSLVVSISLILMSLLANFFFLLNKNEKIYLAFTVFALATGLGLMSIGQIQALFWNAPEFWFWMARITQTTSMVGLGLFMEQIWGVGYKSIFRRLWQFWLGIIILDATLRFGAIYIPLEIPAIVSLLLFVGAVLWMAFRGNVEARVLAVGLGIYMSAVGIYIFYNILGTTPSNYWLSGGLLGFVGSMAAVMGNRFAQVYRQLGTYSQELETKNTALQHLDKLKDDFLANTSHELRTPLNGIIGLAESLLDGIAGRLPDKACSDLSLIVSSGRRLTHLVNDLLDFAKLKHQDLTLQRKPLDLHALVSVVFTLSQPLVAHKAVHLVNQIAPETPPVWADENRVQQILHNLIGNAIKFTGQGEVTVSAEVVGQGTQTSEVSAKRTSEVYLAVTVADTGIGIPADKLDRIFESFEQADGSTAREYGGTGLGLAITKQLVELHGGSIRVESVPEVGSRFTFTLPLADKAEPVVNVSSGATEVAKVRAAPETLLQPDGENGSPVLAPLVPSTPATMMRQGKILVVDDEPVNRQVLVNFLTPQNYALTQATNGPEALALLEQGYKPDLVLLDVMMPRMTGYEVCQTIRQRWAANEMPVVFLSAKSQVSDVVVGLQAEANDYLTKPISKDELLARIETHLNLTRLVAENVRLEAELDVARHLQQLLLPKAEELKKVTGLDIAGFMEPADEVGGDYYDILQHNGQIKISMGDVTGHGLESGVIMLMTQMGVRTLLTSGETDPVRFLDILNRSIYENGLRMQSQRNITLVLLDYTPAEDDGAGELRVSGQHEQVIVIRTGGTVELVDTMALGFPVGLEPEIADFVGEVSLKLEPGDGIVLYTDGFTEAENINREFYGLERLCEVARANWTKSAEGVRQALVEDVRAYIGRQTIYDDLALVVVKQK